MVHQWFSIVSYMTVRPTLSGMAASQRDKHCCCCLCCWEHPLLANNSQKKKRKNSPNKYTTCLLALCEKGEMDMGIEMEREWYVLSQTPRGWEWCVSVCYKEGCWDCGCDGFDREIYQLFGALKQKCQTLKCEGFVLSLFDMIVRWRHLNWPPWAERNY